jgi:hypothetical protein
VNTHASNPRWRRLIRHEQRRVDRVAKLAQRRAPKPVPSPAPAAAGRCHERDRFGHRCTARGQHEMHRAFKREWMGQEA